MSNDEQKNTILLLNFGGPKDIASVRSFLFHMFKDPEILPIQNTGLRWLAASGISWWRYKKSGEMYKKIGGRSPILEHTERQASETQKILAEEGFHAKVRPAYSYTSPFIEDVVQEEMERGVENMLSFPLFPQYSFTTTRGSLARVERAIENKRASIQLFEINSWFSHPLFLKSHAELIQETLKNFSAGSEKDIHILFSAHSIPEKLVKIEGDPYQDHVQKTVQGILEASNWQGDFSLAWQSRLGPVKWLDPSVEKTLERLGKEKVKKVLVVPISFVSDHVETLYEIDQIFGSVAAKAGITEFHRTPGLNEVPLFIKTLADIAKSEKEFWKS